MALTPIKSSNIKACGYDQAQRRLTIQFHSGTTHHYDDVDEKHHDGLIGAESPGKYFHSHIRNAHKSTKAEEDE